MRDEREKERERSSCFFVSWSPPQPTLWSPVVSKNKKKKNLFLKFFGICFLFDLQWMFSAAVFLLSLLKREGLLYGEGQERKEVVEQQ